jgi:hypothetical protein
MIDDSYGLKYHLAAAIAEHSIIERLARQHPTATAIRLSVAHLGLLPVTADLVAEVALASLCQVRPSDAQPWASDGIDDARALTGPESGFKTLTTELLTLFEMGSHHGRLAYLEADYMGREGWQSAVVLEDGRILAGPLLLGRHEFFSSATAPISVALRTLGVTAVGRRDEFVVAGLGRCRTTDDWVRYQQDEPW